MHVTALVLAAGKGLRLSRGDSSKISKPLIAVNSKPLVICCLNILSRHPYIKDIIVVANPDNLKDICRKIKQYHIGKIKDIVLGGSLRQDSVRNGLEAIDKQADLILIHDGVRPFINKEIVSSVIDKAKKYGAAIVAVPVKATIKEVQSNLIVKNTPNRSSLWEIQTPQVFKKNLLLEAYQHFGDKEVTDDSMLVEKVGAKVNVVLGSYSNIKITTPEDLVLAEAIARNLNQR